MKKLVIGAATIFVCLTALPGLVGTVLAAVSPTKTVTPTSAAPGQSVTVQMQFPGGGQMFRAPADTYLVMDRTGSMSGTWSTPSITKIESAKAALTAFINKTIADGGNATSPGDFVGLVTYAANSGCSPVSNCATIDFPIANMTSGNQTAIKNAIAGITPSGSTPIGAGLKVASDDLFAKLTTIDSGRKGVGHYLILASDGEQNTVPSPFQSNIIQDAITHGFVVFTIGIGTDVNNTSVNCLGCLAADGVSTPTGVDVLKQVACMTDKVDPDVTKRCDNVTKPAPSGSNSFYLNGTPRNYYQATNNSDFSSIYEQIAGQISVPLQYQVLDQINTIDLNPSSGVFKSVNTSTLAIVNCDPARSWTPVWVMEQDSGNNGFLLLIQGIPAGESACLKITGIIRDDAAFIQQVTDNGGIKSFNIDYGGTTSGWSPAEAACQPFPPIFNLTNCVNKMMQFPHTSIENGSITIGIPPAQPTGVSVTPPACSTTPTYGNLFSTRVAFNWTPVAGAVEYNVRVAKQGTTNYVGNYDSSGSQFTSGGRGYLSGGSGSFDVLFIGGGTPAPIQPARATAYVTDGVITSVKVNAQGSGYKSPPQLDFQTNGGGGTGAVGTISLNYIFGIYLVYSVSAGINTAFPHTPGLPPVFSSYVLNNSISTYTDDIPFGWIYSSSAVSTSDPAAFYAGSGDNLTFTIDRTYTFEVQAVSSVGVGSAWSTATFTTAQCPAQYNLQVQFDDSTWKDSALNPVAYPSLVFQPGDTVHVNVKVTNLTSSGPAFPGTDLYIYYTPTGIPSCPGTAATSAPLDAAGVSRGYTVGTIPAGGSSFVTIPVQFTIGAVGSSAYAIAVPKCNLGITYWPGTIDAQTYSVNASGFFETLGGDVGSAGVGAADNIGVSFDSSTITPTPLYQSDYVIAAKNISANASTKTWKIGSYVSKQAPTSGVYEYLKGKFYQKALPSCLFDANPMSKCNTNFVVNSPTSPAGDNIIFVDGNLEINQNLTLTGDKTLIFIVSGDITVKKSVTEIDGVFISKGSFNDINTAVDLDGGLDQQNKFLTVKGAVYVDATSGSLNLERLFTGPYNRTTPSDKFIFEPKYLLKPSIINLIGVKSINWTEINP